MINNLYCDAYLQSIHFAMMHNKGNNSRLMIQCQCTQNVMKICWYVTMTFFWFNIDNKKKFSAGVKQQKVKLFIKLISMNDLWHLIFRNEKKKQYTSNVLNKHSIPRGNTFPTLPKGQVLNFYKESKANVTLKHRYYTGTTKGQVPALVESSSHLRLVDSYISCEWRRPDSVKHTGHGSE